MGARTRYRKRDASPSPNSYTLPSLLGSRVPNKQASSAYSMAGRPITGSFSEDLAKSPGPGRYDTTEIVAYSPKAPAYSMLSRRTKAGGVDRTLHWGQCHAPYHTHMDIYILQL